MTAGPGKERPKKANGRPRKYSTPEELDQAVNAYVEKCAAEDIPLTWTGMAIALGFTSRQGVDNYQSRSGFFDSIKRAKLLVEHAYELRLFTPSPAGAIFALKNYGWMDESSIRHSGGIGDKDPDEISEQEKQSRLSRLMAVAMSSKSKAHR